MCGLDRYIAFDKGAFIGREAARKEREIPPLKRLVLMAVEASDADARAYDPIWVGEQSVGFVTSGAYGHHAGCSLALGYIDRGVGNQQAGLEISILGQRCAAEIELKPPYDGDGCRLRN